MRAEYTSQILAARITARSWQDPNGCLIWQGATDPDGYGRVWNGARTVLAHRAAWSASMGPVPDDLKVLHSCDTPPCVNVQHLRVGTQAENVADAVARGRTRSREKLTDEQVRAIRAQYSTLPPLMGQTRPRDTAQALAEEYGITARHVRDLVAGLYRRDV